MSDKKASVLAAASIILAAGRSMRFGRDKRLECINGRPMLLHAALLMASVVPDTLVVLGPDDHALASILAAEGLRATLCEQARSGMGHSLAHGVVQRPDAAGWLIMPADMPFMQRETIQAVMDAACSHDMAAPRHAGRRGHPVWFSHRFGAALRALTGDEGAKALVKAHVPCTAGNTQAAQAGGLWMVDVQDAGCLLDVDTPDDLIARP
ncbi:NTP transferase domain-containing protein [Pusillimonas sp. ANT_WB101]|uniref:nucleotidyltransferase family protein n=1 Tax=Pusillimonas sp. ANT_WB101 TaxID=2597356 RepID=UPI0011ECE96D|nr:nucleotidyltransferase family protein [Pusillimonas sp. ANT_WB101]KAA0910527.1 nucleotidyltransferase family protein [Pusillimonas sp. ANT_WB101]